MERSTRTRQSPAGLFDGYLDPTRPYAGAYDETFAADGAVRQAYRRLHDQLDRSAPAELGARAEALDRALVDRGSPSPCPARSGPFRWT